MTENDIPNPDISTDDGQAAERYVTAELKKAKDGLLRTQVLSVASVVLVGGYLGYVTSRFRESLAPQEAATIAQGLINGKVDEGGAQLVEYVKKEVPAYIRQVPDYALKELPNYRTELEARVTTEVERYAKESSDRLGAALDEFLETNKESVGELIDKGSDPTATAEITRAMRKMFVEYVESTPAGGESLKAKLNAALVTLNKADAKMARLATAKNLTPSEVRAKRAVAILLRQIAVKRIEEGRTAPLATEAIKVLTP